MTQKEILQYNKMCAEFLGWKETTEQFKIDWVGCKTKERLDRLNKQYIPILEKNGDVLFPDFSMINFHSDWNWIMEVVEGIEKLNMEVSIIDEECCIIDTEKAEKEENPFMIEPVSFGEGESKKEAVVEAINHFLIWYEKNK